MRACCLQQRAASAVPLHQAARVCLLMHVGVAQASSRMYLERQVRPLVSTVEQVRVGCRRRGMYALLPNLVSVHNAEEDARPEYM
jgi:hypothetical protein